MVGLQQPSSIFSIPSAHVAADAAMVGPNPTPDIPTGPVTPGAAAVGGGARRRAAARRGRSIAQPNPNPNLNPNANPNLNPNPNPNPNQVEALLARALLKRRRRHRRQMRRARPSALLRSLGGAAYFTARWAWGRRAKGVITR